VHTVYEQPNNLDSNYPLTEWHKSIDNISKSINLDSYERTAVSTSVAKDYKLRVNGNTVMTLPRAPQVNPEAGDMYYSDADNMLRCYNGTVWKDLF